MQAPPSDNLVLFPLPPSPQRSSANDGVYFPRDPQSFRDEVRRQASELYGGRSGLSMDTSRLLRGGASGSTPSGDQADFESTMLSFLHPALAMISADAPISIDDLFRHIGRGSAATSLDELPNLILRRLAGYGVNGIAHLLHQLAAGCPSVLLNGVLHIPLRKKEPTWLVANSRPVLLEPSLRRLEANVVFQRQQRRFELAGTLPSCMFAYRKQLSPQIAALLTR